MRNWNYERIQISNALEPNLSFIIFTSSKDYIDRRHCSFKI